MSEKLLSISQAAALLNRKPRTLRDWEQSGRLPEYLYPTRDHNGDRRYTPELVEHIREWLVAEGSRSTIEHARKFNSRVVDTT